MEVYQKETPAEVYSFEFFELFHNRIFTEHLCTSASPLSFHQALMKGLSTLCFSAPAESTSQNFPVKMRAVKLLPGEKCFNFLPHWYISYYLAQPGGSAEPLIFPGEILNFIRMSFFTTPVILLRQSSVPNIVLLDHGNLRWLFTESYWELNLRGYWFGYDKLFLFIFTDFLLFTFYFCV